MNNGRFRQNGFAESSADSVNMLGRTVMAESGVGGRFWFSATMNGVNCRNTTFKKRLGTTPHVWVKEGCLNV